MNLCASVTPHLFSDLIWKLIFPSFPLPFRSLSAVVFILSLPLLSKAFVGMEFEWGNKQGYVH